MSNKVTIKRVVQDNYGDVKEFRTSVIKDAPPKAADYASRFIDMPVDTRSLVNRCTEVKNLVKNLRVRGGFDGDMWQAPRAGRVKSTGEVFIFDGDHSRHLYKIKYPQNKTMPMQIIDVDSKADIHRLFVQVNKTCSTGITAEQEFVHKYHMGDSESVRLVEILAQTGLHIFGSNEEGGVLGDPEGDEIRHSYFRSVVGAAGGDPVIVKEARDLIKKCKNPIKTGGPISGQSMRGLCQVFSAYPDLRPNGQCGSEFEEFFVNLVNHRTPDQFSVRVALDCKSDMKKEWRVAAGIVSEIADYQKVCPQAFAPLQKGKTQRIQVGALKKLAKSRTTGRKKKS